MEPTRSGPSTVTESGLPTAPLSLPRPVRAPGMHDVARLAGVSHMTVSRVLNDHPSVSSATRRKVRAAIDELGYRRNVAARTLVTRRSDTIGIITSSSTLFGPSSTMIAVERAARDAGFYVAVASLASIDSSAVVAAISRRRLCSPGESMRLAPAPGRRARRTGHPSAWRCTGVPTPPHPAGWWSGWG